MNYKSGLKIFNTRKNSKKSFLQFSNFIKILSMGKGVWVCAFLRINCRKRGGRATYTGQNFVNSILNLNKCSAQEKKEQEWEAGQRLRLRKNDRFFKICSTQDLFSNRNKSWSFSSQEKISQICPMKNWEKLGNIFRKSFLQFFIFIKIMDKKKILKFGPMKN